jgi:hypothetical protein
MREGAIVCMSVVLSRRPRLAGFARQHLDVIRGNAARTTTN